MNGTGRLPGDPSGVPGATLGLALRTVATGARLGWAIESNWSDPLLFVIYSVAKPVASALILVAILFVVTGAGDPQVVAYFVVGTALWNFVGGGLVGLVFGILDDRERYRMLKYVFLAPASLMPFLLGRSAARVVIAAAGAVITLAVGWLLLGVRIDLLTMDWPLFLVSMAIGMVAIGALGIAMGGLCLQLRQEAWSYPEAVAGALYLVAGVVFPIDVLPAALQGVALAMPFTWWLEGSRRALLGAPTPGIMAGFDDPTVVFALLVSTAVLTLMSWVAFRAFVNRARERGLIDRVTSS
ncbi:MAG: ABC transporter permease [Chloroflexota bacterium]